jgi:hypothetical protein
MRRLALMLTVGGCLALMLACGTSISGLWASRGEDLILPGASSVQIDRSGITRLQITYRFSPNQTRQQLRRHLTQQGWTQITIQNINRMDWVFTRQLWFGIAREIAVVSLSSANHRDVTISVGPCIRISDWTRCL